MSARRRVVVTGMGVICPLGDSPQRLGAALAAGDSGLAPVEGFDATGLPCRLAGEVKSFNPAEYLGGGNLRPLDRTSRLAAVAAQLALADSGWSAERRQGRAVGLVLGTMFGSVHTISEFDRRALTAGPNYAKPMDFANSVINAAAGQTAIWHGLDGVNSTIAGGVTAGLSALAYATELIAAGRAEVLLAGGADELCLESFLGFARAGLTCHVGDEGERPVPFDARRNGFAPAEAGALLVLEEAEAAERRGATVLAEIRGHGNAFDPSRGRDDTQAAAALGRAVRLALADGGAAPAAVDAVGAGASGSVAGDRQEALGLADGLGAEVARRVPVTAVKAMLGEGLGASGALQAVALIQAMGTGTLPGIAGLEEAEAGLPLGSLSADSRSLPLRCALATGLGFEGNAVALLLGRGEAAG